MSLGLMPISSLKNLMDSSLSGQLVQMYSRMTSFQYALKSEFKLCIGGLRILQVPSSRNCPTAYAVMPRHLFMDLRCYGKPTMAWVDFNLKIIASSYLPIYRNLPSTTAKSGTQRNDKAQRQRQRNIGTESAISLDTLVGLT